MNITDSKRHFEKLSSFYKQISADGQINNIELDLLKSYTLSFYETLVSDSSTPAASQPVREVARAQAPVTPVAPIQPVNSPTPTPVAAPNAEPIAEQAPAEVNVESSNKFSSKQSNELDQLFSLETGTEISDKLGTTSIKDINKAMSINERIFTIKELFGGSKENYDKTIGSLNELISYDDAKKYLSENVVSENNWLAPEKGKKVKNFLKLISRKYV